MTSKKNIRKILGANVRSLRNGLKLAQDEFADRISISTSNLSDIENGKCFPRVATLEKIAEILKLEPCQLFVDNGHIFNIEFTKDSYKILLEMINEFKNDESSLELLLKYAQLLKAHKSKNR